MFPENSRVCFLGDSITAMGKWIARIFDCYSSNFKENSPLFYNCGVAGGTVTEAIDRLDEDVLIFKPTHVVIMFGMNDGDITLYTSDVLPTEEILIKRREKIEGCISSIEVIADKIKSYGAELVFCTPTPFDNYQKSDTPNNFYQDCLEIISKKIKKLSCKYSAPCIDFNTFILENIIKYQKEDDSAALIMQDRIHPNETGQELMACYFLRQQGFECSIDKNFSDLKHESVISLSDINLKRYELEQKLRIP